MPRDCFAEYWKFPQRLKHAGADIWYICLLHRHPYLLARPTCSYGVRISGDRTTAIYCLCKYLIDTTQNPPPGLSDFKVMRPPASRGDASGPPGVKARTLKATSFKLHVFGLIGLSTITLHAPTPDETPCYHHSKRGSYQPQARNGSMFISTQMCAGCDATDTQHVLGSNPLSWTCTFSFVS